MREKLANMQPEKKMQQLTCKHTNRYRITHTHKQTIKFTNTNWHIHTNRQLSLLTLIHTYTQTDN